VIKKTLKLSVLTLLNAIFIASLSSLAFAENEQALDILTWGGAYQISQDKAYFGPFEQSQSIKINPRAHMQDGGQSIVDHLAKDTNWDVADLTSEDERKACEKGLLLPIKLSDVLADGEEALEDFLPGAIGKCGIGSVAWSSVIISNRRKFRKRQPKTVRDLFDLRRFPGKRALPKGPKYLLELALMADGVPASEVYSELDTVDGEDRAFDKLEKLRGEIIWWDQAGEPLKILEDGGAVMAMAYSGRAFNDITSERHPFDIIWDGQIFDIDYWAISKKSDAGETALKFVGFALASERLADQARWFPYGPMRKSAVAIVGKHALLGVEMKPFIPTTPENMKTSLRLDTKWWALNQKRLNTRFEAWFKDEKMQENRADASETTTR